MSNTTPLTIANPDRSPMIAASVSAGPRRDRSAEAHDAQVRVHPTESPPLLLNGQRDSHDR
jgi:hypothetical protein